MRAIALPPRGIGARLEERLGLSADRDLARTSRRATGIQRERHAPEYGLLIAIVALAALGVLMVYSSSALRAYLQDEDPFAVVGPQLVWAALGLAAMAVTMRIDYRWLRILSVPMYITAVALLALVLLPPIGPFEPKVVGGSARWLTLGSLPAIHPAEFAKLAMIVYLAHWMARQGGRIGSVVHGTIPFLLLAAPVLLLVVREPDLGTTGVLTLTAFTMFVVAGADLRQFLVLIPAGIAGLWYVINENAYQLLRVEAFLDPWRDPLGKGFHTIQGLLALGLGGLLGEGLGQSTQAGSLYLPNASNDFIFAVIAEEFGLVGGLIVIALFLAFAFYGIRVALAAPDTFGGLLAAGITAWVTAQAFINVAVVVSLLPITGITLPFVSAGGSSLIVSFAAVGILLSISRETQPRGTWNDADPHRGRRHGRTHLSRTGRRALPPRAPARR
jgi:cell division protein FtsW